jgi:uncharacterized membrane protein
MTAHRHSSWLLERRRSGAGLVAALVLAAAMAIARIAPEPLTVPDASVLVLLAYLLTYLVLTVAAFANASEEQVAAWAERDSRGTFLQRYVLGSAPGPGVSLFIAAAALVVAVIWLPGRGGDSFPDTARVLVGVVLVVVGWVCVLVSFALTFLADDLVEDRKALAFPGGSASWSGYLYFAVSVMTTFGTTDVDVLSDEMRRTVAFNAVIAFVYNAVTVATVVSVLAT